MESGTRQYINPFDPERTKSGYVEAALRSHAPDLNAASVLPQGQCRVLAIDGKIFRGSIDTFHDGPAKQILCAFAAETALILRLKINAKSNEIPAA